MGKIKGCFIDDQPNFYKEVKLDGEIIGKIHALTENDYAAIEDEAYRKRISEGTYEIDVNSRKLGIMRIYRSLIGESECFWEMESEITKEAVGKLLPKYRDAFLNAVNELEKQNEVTEGIEKN